MAHISLSKPREALLPGAGPAFSLTFFGGYRPCLAMGAVGPRGYIGVCRDTGKENGNYYSI